MLAKSHKITFEEFLEIDKESKEGLEFIDNTILNQASPTTIHQRIVLRLANKFSDFFKGKSCEPFISPFDVFLKEKTTTHKVQPDLMVICDKNGLNEKNYIGVPTLIVEVLSPSTTSRDFIEKMNIYMKFGVKEYWIVSPKNNEIQVFILENGFYNEPISRRDTGIIKSSIFEDFEIDIEEIFY